MISPAASTSIFRISFGLRGNWPRFLYAFAALAVVGLAAGLRLAWANDIEYKGDESFMFEALCSVQEGEPWPRQGIPTSQKTPSHPMSIWVFLVVDAVFHCQTPTELARVSQFMDVLAIAGLLAFIGVCVHRESRPIWFGAAVLAAVNPLTVLLHRKIWNVSIISPLLLLVLIGFWHRDRRWGALLWGAVVTLVGLIHPPGLFLAAGLAGGAFLQDRRRVRWGWWAAGTAAIGWALIPWLLDVYADMGDRTNEQIRLNNICSASFWLYWVTEPCGISLHYSLGRDFFDFWRYPIFFDRPSYLVGGLHAVLAVVIARIYLVAAIGAWKNRSEIVSYMVGNDRGTWQAVAAVLVGFGAVATLSCVPVHRHYMLHAFPMMYVWLASIALVDHRPISLGFTRGQARFALLCVLQFAVSVSFLSYIHENQRTIRGDYGTPYSAQVRFGLPPR